MVRRQDGFHRDLIQPRPKSVEHDVNHAEPFADEELLHKLSGPHANRRCAAVVADRVGPKAKKLAAQATSLELAPDHSPCEINHPRCVQGPTSACSDLAELLQDKIRAWEVVEERSVAITVRRNEKLRYIAFEYLKTRVTIRL